MSTPPDNCSLQDVLGEMTAHTAPSVNTNCKHMASNPCPSGGLNALFLIGGLGESPLISPQQQPPPAYSYEPLLRTRRSRQMLPRSRLASVAFFKRPGHPPSCLSNTHGTTWCRLFDWVLMVDCLKPNWKVLIHKYIRMRDRCRSPTYCERVPRSSQSDGSGQMVGLWNQML